MYVTAARVARKRRQTCPYPRVERSSDRLQLIIIFLERFVKKKWRVVQKYLSAFAAERHIDSSGRDVL